MAETRNRVLIVDDEVFFLEAINEILSGAGVETWQAEDGKSARAAGEDPTIGGVVLGYIAHQDGVRFTSLTVSVDEVTGQGAIAYARGLSAIPATLADGSSFSERGSFLEIHRRGADGDWPYTRLIWGPDSPPPGSGAGE